jgi:hypothetical protein
VLLSYLDESATKDRFYIAAVCVPESQLVPLTKALDDVVAKAAKSFGIDEATELHGHEIVNGKGPWKPFAQEHRIRIGVYDDAMAAIGSHDVHIILRGLDIARQRERYARVDPPHSVVLPHTLERIDELAAARDDYALVIADEAEGQNDHRRDLWIFQRQATWGYRSRQLARIVDTMHFVPSHHSRLVQAADLVAFLYRRRQTHTERDARSERANAALWARVQPRVWHAGIWLP